MEFQKRSDLTMDPSLQVTSLQASVVTLVPEVDVSGMWGILLPVV